MVCLRPSQAFPVSCENCGYVNTCPHRLPAGAVPFLASCRDDRPGSLAPARAQGAWFSTWQMRCKKPGRALSPAPGRARSTSATSSSATTPPTRATSPSSPAPPSARPTCGPTSWRCSPTSASRAACSTWTPRWSRASWRTRPATSTRRTPSARPSSVFRPRSLLSAPCTSTAASASRCRLRRSMATRSIRTWWRTTPTAARRTTPACSTSTRPRCAPAARPTSSRACPTATAAAASSATTAAWRSTAWTTSSRTRRPRRPRPPWS